MDNKQDILELFCAAWRKKGSPEDAAGSEGGAFEDLDYAKIDFHRSVRQGAAEVIYGAGKTPEQIRGIVCTMGERGCRNILVTRISPEAAELLSDAVLLIITLFEAGCRISGETEKTGTYRRGYRQDDDDMPVAEEAALTAERWKSCDPAL